MRFSWSAAFLLASFLLGALPAAAADSELSLAIKDHAFVPAELTLPAKTHIKLTIKNEDAAAMEFECPDLRREKVVPAGGEGIVYVGPLSPGTFECFDDFRPETRGHLIVK
jgi:hypothetical protein